MTFFCNNLEYKNYNIHKIFTKTFSSDDFDARAATVRVFESCM